MTEPARTSAERARRTIDVVAFALAVALSAVVLFVPSTGGLPGFPYADKLVHASVFGLLAWTGVRAGLRPIALGAALVAYAVGSEIVQATLLPHRDGDVTDAAADTAGMILGLLATRGGRQALAKLVGRRDQT